MQGRRVQNDNDDLMSAGDYWHAHGNWWAHTPSGLIANLRSHEVTEHEDGTITVSPSILVTRWDGMQWHGYLERGVWREV